MKNTINNELDKLEKIYLNITAKCDEYFDYDCNRCPYNKMCDLLGEILANKDENGDDEK